MKLQFEGSTRPRLVFERKVWLILLTGLLAGINFIIARLLKSVSSE